MLWNTGHELLSPGNQRPAHCGLSHDAVWRTATKWQHAMSTAGHGGIFVPEWCHHESCSASDAPRILFLIRPKCFQEALNFPLSRTGRGSHAGHITRTNNRLIWGWLISLTGAKWARWPRFWKPTNINQMTERLETAPRHNRSNSSHMSAVIQCSFEAVPGWILHHLDCCRH